MTIIKVHKQAYKHAVQMSIPSVSLPSPSTNASQPHCSINIICTVVHNINAQLSLLLLYTLPLHSMLPLYSVWSDLSIVLQCAAIARLKHSTTKSQWLINSPSQLPLSTISVIFASSVEIIGNVFVYPWKLQYSFSEWSGSRVKLVLKIYDSKCHQQCFLS